MTSDELLEGCDHLYRSIVIIGGGVIGIEFATFYADLGCAVTVIEGMDRLLPNMDKELGQNLALILKKQGVKVFTNAMVQRVEQAGEDIAVQLHLQGKGARPSPAKRCSAPSAAVRTATACSPTALAVEMNGRSIAVNENFETSIPHVYAIGDVSAKIQLAHVATAQGIACVELPVRQCRITHRSLGRAELHLLPSGDRGRRPHRGRGQGGGHPRQGRQACHVRQRQDAHRRPGPLPS